MYEVMIQQLGQVRHTARAALGAAGAAGIVMVIEYLKWRKDDEEATREDIRDLDKQIAKLQAEIAALQAGGTGPNLTVGSSASSFAPYASQIVVERQLSPFQQVLRSQITAGNVLVQTGGTGAGGSAALLTMGGMGELNTVQDFGLRIVTGASGAAGGVPLARFIPPTILKGPVRVRLSPAGTLNASVEALKAYYAINYASDGLTVISIDIGAAAAVTPGASTTYDIQVKVDPAPVAATVNQTAEFTTDILHPATTAQVGLVNVS